MRSAFAPAHITGFFEISMNSNPLYCGSRGAGVSIEHGVITTVRAIHSDSNDINIKINGINADNFPISVNVISKILSKTNNTYSVYVDHEVQVPIGAGLGSSGSIALSLVYALNAELDLGLSILESAQIAHIAEIECGTGLGTVIAEYFGGFEIRSKPGAPGIGDITNFRNESDDVIVIAFFDSIETNKVLKDQNLVNLINEYGNEYMEKFLVQPNLKNFMTFSQDFSTKLSVMPKNLISILETCRSKDIICSMCMFGNTLFSIVNQKERLILDDILKTHSDSNPSILFSSVDECGARLI
jgi:pantoate kinase